MAMERGIELGHIRVGEGTEVFHFVMVRKATKMPLEMISPECRVIALKILIYYGVAKDYLDTPLQFFSGIAF